MAVAFGLALVVGLQGDDAVAKKRKKSKSSVTATIDGNRSTWKKKNVLVDVDAGVPAVNIIAAIAHPRLAQLNKILKGVGVSCQLDLASTFPVTPAFPAFCVMSYTEIKFRAPIVTRSWGGSNVGDDVTVTYESHENGRLTGTFHGTLTSQDVPPNPPVTVDGQFSVDVGS
jgi:hypothetical protein